MNEQKDKNIGLFENDPFPKDVWEIAYKNTGGKPFEKESSFSQADEKTENATQSPKSSISLEQQRLKSELKAKQEQRQTSAQVRNSTTNYSTTIITDTADRKTSTNAYSAPSSYKPDNEEHGSCKKARQGIPQRSDGEVEEQHQNDDRNCRDHGFFTFSMKSIPTLYHRKKV